MSVEGRWYNEMEAKEDGDTSEECSSSPIQVWRQISKDAARMDGEALQSVYSASSPPSGRGHRRCQSEVSTAERSRNSSFGRWKAQVQKALQWGSHLQNRSRCSSFNPEVLTNQKRQWYQFNSKTPNQKKYEEPTSLFENFIIVGLHPDANLEVVEAAFAKRKAQELYMEKYDMIDLKLLQNQEASSSTLEPQILFKYPPGSRLAVRPKDLAAFCFPGSVKARVLEKSPSLSDLNELIYGQEHLSRDDLSFIFSLKVADNATLYGVCLHVQEIVQRAPNIFGAASPIPQSSRGFSRFLVAASRCYCVLTRVPFFELHYEMLNSIIAQDRLNRITQFVSEMSLIDYVPSGEKVLNPLNGNINSPYDLSSTDWMGSAIPIGNVLAHTAVAAGIILEDEVPSYSSRWESLSPESGSSSEMLDHFQTREIVKDGRKNLHYFDDSASEASESRSEGLDRTNGSYDNGQTPVELRHNARRRSRTLDHLESPESLFSPVRSIGSEDEDDEIILSREKEAGDEIIMEWARDNKNDMLQIVCGYHAMPIPAWGSEIVFQPLEHLKAIEYWRPRLSALGLSEKFIEQKFQLYPGAAEVNMKLAGAEEALALSIWTTATICRVLSLENVLLLIAGVLLEKQVAVLCPNLGVLSAVVLSLIPMIRPFEWQSLFLPVLLGKMLDFLEAPVPFIVGIQHKPADWKIKTSNFVHVNLVNDQVKTCHLPALPQRKELISKLQPIHARLSSEKPIATRHPIYRCNEVQAEAAAQFLAVMRHYMESLCSDLRSHTITSVQSNNDRVSLLLKDTFIDSFPGKDQPFFKSFVDTQMFTVLSDVRLSSFENEH